MIAFNFATALVMSFCCSFYVFAAGHSDSAVLNKVDPPDALQSVFVERNNIKIEPMLGMAILVGDKITLASKSAAVLLVAKNGQRKWVRYPESPYVFSIDSPSLVDSFFKIANTYGLLRDVIPNDGKMEIAQASVRGIDTTVQNYDAGCGCVDCPILIPTVTEQPSVKLVAGERALALYWVGGKSPYKVRLLKNEKVIQEFVGIKDVCHFSLTKHNWQPGVYTLELSDKNEANNWQEKTLTFVDVSDLPSFPDALSSSELDLDERTLLQADWLARQGDGEWQLEAVQRVFPLVGRHKLADDWMHYWARGQWP
ncbi:hypothetical protein [Thiosulfativibrio zosterae]|uniref:DUF4384 domain-containing protein n=1 Tax=Thiosulfativibrio zosterae TaxID=2675053 RepID=A0A6F8PQX8_9GAMM|nr:hypothetical protein [Thiosulfativibrio zosterae]BBP44519.1 hypothetical protein THMIRHAT_22650 [Thiosulfativibrio zosterae]